MKHQIKVDMGRGVFDKPLYPRPLIAGDINAYEIVAQCNEDISDCAFKVKAVKADETSVEDVGTTSGNTARYTLKNNMYDVKDNLTLWLSIVSPDGSVLTDAKIEFDVDCTGDEPGIAGDDRVPALDTLMMEAKRIENILSALLAGLGGSPIIVINESDYIPLTADKKHDPNAIYLVVIGK